MNWMGKYESMLNSFVSGGSAVNTTVVMGAGEGVVKSRDANLLKENGGSIDLTKGWAQSVSSRMGMVKRKACSKNKVHFDIVKEQFLLDIKQLVDLEDIPPALIINWDQTAINYVPPASWTMEVERSKRVDLAGKDDKGRSPLVLEAQWKVIFYHPNWCTKNTSLSSAS